MLNRRILRGKVMQFLYALKQAEASNFHHAHDYFKDVFSPDLNSMEVQDHTKLKNLVKEASASFNASYEEKDVHFKDESIEVRKIVIAAIDTYNKSVQKDRKFYLNLMVESTEGLLDVYAHALIFPSELNKYLLSGEDSKTLFKIFVDSQPDLFSDNRVFQAVEKNQALSQIAIRKNLRWEKEILRNTVIGYIDKNEEYKNLLIKKDKTFEEQKEIMLQLFKKFFFQNQYVQEYLEENEMHWSENKSIVKSMVSKTIKAVNEENENIEIINLSTNWEEDKEFFIQLYNNTIDEDKFLEGIISRKSKHWDIERVAALDKIILKMALAEMMHFSSIPVKVTINEYIELSKVYSTPKSKQFVNGILDKISAELIEEGMIKKSGRGLIDNK